LPDEFVFHIRNAQPGDMVAALATLEVYPGLSTITEIVEHAETLGFTIRDRQRLEALMTVRDLGLVAREQNVLTSNGKVLTQLEMDKPDLFADVVHGLQYVLWDDKQPSAYCFSWSYRKLCQMLWQSGVTTLTSRREIASEIEAQARTVFGRSDIAFSPKSIGGALLWLSELKPSVLDESGKKFNRRTFCPPELFVLAVDFVYSTQGVDYGANLLLSDEHRDAICQVCLLDPSGFDRVLEYVVTQFDYLEKGLGGGWGRYLTLRHGPMVEEFV